MTPLTQFQLFNGLEIMQVTMSVLASEMPDFKGLFVENITDPEQDGGFGWAFSTPYDGHIGMIEAVKIKAKTPFRKTLIEYKVWGPVQDMGDESVGQPPMVGCGVDFAENPDHTCSSPAMAARMMTTCLFDFHLDQRVYDALQHHFFVKQLSEGTDASST